MSLPWLLGCRWGDWGGQRSAQFCALWGSLCFLHEPWAGANTGFKTDWSERNVSGQKTWEAACEDHAVALSHPFGSLNRAPDKSIYYTWLLMFEGIYIWTRFWHRDIINQLLTGTMVLSLQAAVWALRAFRQELPEPCLCELSYISATL